LPKKILIELPTWLGDCVMATPAIENIVNFHNEVEIILIVKKVLQLDIQLFL
jgi:heptosyltransferase-2